MNELEQHILDVIKEKPGQLAREIAAQLGIDRRIVNSALYSSLRSKVQQDNTYRWYPKNAPVARSRDDGGPKQLNTSLARLCRYYLDCLSHDDLGGVSEFAASKYGDANYVEVQALPMFDENPSDPFGTEAGRKLLTRIRRDRNRQTVILGYPVRLSLRRSRKGWEGFMIEPLLLFAFDDPNSKYDKLTLSNDAPQINFRALRALSNAGETSLLEEAIQLYDELGLGTAVGDQPALDELLARLRGIRSDWDWREEIDPYALRPGIPLSDLNQQGIFNRAVLIAAERSPYTRGLESELGKLQTIEEEQYKHTVLGTWLSKQLIEAPLGDQQPLLEVLPLNSEQHQAVRQSLSNPLTVITGPPGTGKSQVVSSILVNAAWQGKTVLFASKNNKAVDVVEARVNALGPRPVLLRLGTNEYQAQLAEYLVSLLAASTTADDQRRYRDLEATHAQLRERSDALDAKLQKLIALRNDVDRLEQEVESFRSEVGDDVFRTLQAIDLEKLDSYASQFQFAVEQANRGRQTVMTQLFWPFVRNSRFARLADAVRLIRPWSQKIELPAPEWQPDSTTVDQCVKYVSCLKSRLSQIYTLQQYFGKLRELTEAQPLEDICKERSYLTDAVADNSEALWQAWLQTQPSRMGSEQRKLLGDYGALLQLIVSSNDENRRLGSDIIRRYYELFPQITSILPCWAVTSLSARGRVPFDANFFDVLVIDEASQCDIASALPLLYRARSVVVIGDPMQLRHISTLTKQQDQQLLSKHGLVDEYPGWAYSARSLFDLASSLCRSQDIVALRDHHRSHADIIEFSNEAFYQGRLRVATKYDRLRFPLGGGPAIRWVDVQGKTIRPGTGGAMNEAEAMSVVEEIRRLVTQGYRGSIGVVSPFRAQSNRIRDLVNSQDDIARRVAELDFLADTIHKFQGDERDVMIFSPVVSSGISEAALGFLRSTPNLFNVAVTRARAALVVVGNQSAALHCNVDYLAKFAEYVGQLGNQCPPVSVPPDIDMGPSYPTVSRPELVSEWERVFYRALYGKVIRPVPQYTVEKYVLDFAIFRGQRRLNIEVDGERYHRNWDGELCRRDQIRNQRLIELGWDVMRFWVYQIRDDLDQSVAKVREWTNRGAI